MLGFSLMVACGAKQLSILCQTFFLFYFFACLRSRDISNQLFGITMIQIETFNVCRCWRSYFLGICKGLARARSPQGPTRAQGRARGRAQGRAQGPGEGPGEGPLAGPYPRSEVLDVPIGARAGAGEMEGSWEGLRKVLGSPGAP